MEQSSGGGKNGTRDEVGVAVIHGGGVRPLLLICQASWSSNKIKLLDTVSLISPRSFLQTWTRGQV